ncbi:transmembrane protein, putative [Medicago truncatula]|uniref:Transmembrane protein, putative n=1 Tax=Medicago truncatula TaxID=3880 RepID=A0A072VKN6_MEDTR|nr:transmembrane protein, putative [Medicago truncatula]
MATSSVQDGSEFDEDSLNKDEMGLFIRRYNRYNKRNSLKHNKKNLGHLLKKTKSDVSFKVFYPSNSGVKVRKNTRRGLNYVSFFFFYNQVQCSNSDRVQGLCASSGMWVVEVVFVTVVTMLEDFVYVVSLIVVLALF